MSNFKISDLHTYIVKVAEKELNKSSFLDTVTTGTITASYPGYYQVSLTNSGDVSSVNALSMNDATYAINDYVYLLKAPAKGGDNFNNSYYIFGKVNETKETYANLTDWERFNGNLTTVKIDGSNVVTDSGYLEETFDNENLINDIKESGYFSVSGYFTADSSSDFGLIIELYNDTNAIQTFKLDKNYFTGQIIALTSAYQKRICSITDESKLVALKKIVVKGFNNGGGNPQVQDIVITAGSMYEAANNLEVKVTTLSGYKDYFRNMVPTEVGQDQIGLKATLYYNSQPLAADNIRYYWCIKDSNATAEDSLPFIEPGWRCLNGCSEVDFLGSEEEETVQVWKSSSSMIIDEFDGSFKNELNQNINTNVYKNIFDKTYSSTIACFVKYNGRIFKSSEKNIINYNLHNFKVSLDLNSGNVSDIQKIIYENDAVAAHCTITAEQDGKTLPLPQQAIYTYQWKIKAGDLDITKYLKRERYIKTSDTSKEDGVDYFIAVKDEKGNITSYELYTGTSFEKDVNYYIFESKSLNEILVCSKIIIKDEKTIDKRSSVTQSALDTLTIELPEFIGPYDIQNATIKVSVLISVKVDGADSDAIELQTNEIQIESHTHELEQIHSVFNYKYYFSESMNVTFEKEPRKDEKGDTIDGSWSGNWSIIDPSNGNQEWVPTSGKDHWDPASSTYKQEGLNEIESITPPNELIGTDKKYYLYYTKQEDIFKYIGSEQEETPLDSRTWQYPLVLNVFIWDGQNSNWKKMTSIEVDQINTFNQLTKGGTEDGILYQEEAYVLTEDTTKQPEKTYYTATYSADKTTYTKFNGTSFAEGVSYYEKSSDKNKLYINATYINTGTLRVGDSTREKFYASIHNPDVRIAGWEVDDHSLTKGAVGINSDSTKNDKIAFWAGSETAAAAPFSVTHDGHIKATAGIIGGWTLSKHLSSDEYNFLYNRQSSFGTGLSSTPTGDDPAFWAGFTGEGNTPWNDTQWSDKTNFYVTNNGHLVAKSADITGHINSTSGTIGGYSIGQYTIASGGPLDLPEGNNDDKGAGHAVGMCMESGHGPYAFWAGDESTFSSKKFRVGHNGILWADGAEISGKITATSGSFTGTVKATGGEIGGCEIKDGKLEVPSANITGTLTIGQLPNNVATDDDIPTTAEITTITNDTIKTTNVEAQNLKVKAANITDKLTAGQIDTENLTVSNVANVGNFKIEGGNITSDNLSLSTNGKISKSGAGWIDLSHSFGESTSTARYYVRIRTFTSDSLPSDTETEKNVTYTISLEILGPNAPSKNKSITVRWWYGKDQSSSSSETWTFPKGAYSYSRTVTVPVTLLGLSAAIVTTSGNYVSDSYFDQEVTIAETSKNIAINSSLIPINDSGGQGSHNLGSGDRLWSNIFTVTSQIGVSDKKEKNSIKLLTEQYSQMFDLLKPVSYKFNNGSSNRLHLGFIAQDVEDAIFSVGLTNKDFAGLCSWYKQDGTLGYGLRYSEFIALNTHEIQKLKKRVTEQDQRILELEEKILNFEKLIQTNEN